MGRKKNQNKNPNKKSLNIELNHLMADEYMRMADRTIKKVPKQEKLDKQERVERSASKYIAISLLAFAIELHFKSILFTIKNEIRGGHDLLEDLWVILPKPIQTWLSEAFDENFDSESQKWEVNVSFSPLSFSTHLKKAIYKPIKVETPKNTALGMIQGHRFAFIKGRYAYELPTGPELNHISFNLDGLHLLACLTRELAIHLHKKFDLVNKTDKINDLDEHMSEIPKSIKKFPHNKS